MSIADELKGVALVACHKLLDPELLFRALTRPKRPNWGGSYAFVLHEIERTLEARHVEAGCHWLSGEGRTTNAMQHVAMRVMLLALDRLSDETVRIALAGYVWDHLNRRADFSIPMTENTVICEQF